MKKEKIFLVGIKGVAMTSLAVYLKEKGLSVEGSDLNDYFFTDDVLKSYGIKIHEGFDPEIINRSFDTVIGTGAHKGMENPQMKRARDLGIKTYMHGQYLGFEMSKSEGISVCGCHGKTTVSSIIAKLLADQKMDPSYAIGTAKIMDLGPAGHFGHGRYFVAEADEYVTSPGTDPTPRFMWQKPKIIVITNIDYDHPDVYRDISDTKKAFLEFTSNLREGGTVFLSLDDKNSSDVSKKIFKNKITYGFSERNDLIIRSFHTGDQANFIRLEYKGMDVGEFMLRVPGRHNAMNAAAAMLVSNYLGSGWNVLREKIRLFRGTKRRFEKIYEDGCLLIDDYAHHPQEIEATLEAARNWYKGRRITVIFQPHTFSRTKNLLTFFRSAFKNADRCLVADIYPSAREQPDKSINSEMLVREINTIRNNALYACGVNEVIENLRNNISPDEVLITMGAGDIYLWHDKIINLLKNNRQYEI